MFCTAKFFFCLICLVECRNTNKGLPTPPTKDKIKQRTREIMHPDSQYMRNINKRTREIMRPCSKYMMEIRYRLGLPPPAGQPPCPAVPTGEVGTVHFFTSLQNDPKYANILYLVFGESNVLLATFKFEIQSSFINGTNKIIL